MLQAIMLMVCTVPAGATNSSVIQSTVIPQGKPMMKGDGSQDHYVSKLRVTCFGKY